MSKAVFFRSQKYFNISQIKSEAKTKNIESKIFPLLKNPNFRGVLHKYMFPKINEGSNFIKLKTTPSLEFELLWVSTFINIYKDSLNSFTSMQKEYLSAYFNAEYEQCKEILDSIHNNYGISIWLIESYINLYKQIDRGSKESEMFVDLILKSNVNPIYKISSLLLLLKSEDKVSPTRYEIELDRNIKNWKITDDLNIKDYLYYKFSMNQVNPKLDLAKIMSMEENLSLIDRYHTAIKVLIDCVELEKNTLNLVTIDKVLAVLNNIVDDPVNNYLKVKFMKSPIIKNEDLINQALDFYTSGDYKNTLDICDRILNKEPYTIEIYEIYIKSLLKLELNSDLSDKKLHGNIINTTLKFYNLKNEDDTNDLEAILKICSENANNWWSWKLRSYIYVIYFGTKSIEELDTIKQGLIISKYIKPQLLSFVYTSDSQRNEYIGKIYNNQSITYKVHEAYNSSDISLIEELEIDENRKHRLLANLHANKNDFESALEYYNLMDTDDVNINLFEVSLGKIKSYIELNNINMAINLIVNCYFLDRNLLFEIDNSKIKEVIVDFNFESDNIDYLIYIELISRYLDDKIFENKHYYFEDFLKGNNIDFISELDFTSSKYDRNKLIYLLKNYCDMDTMSKYYLFENYEQVEEERIKICRVLGGLDPENLDKYNDEIKNITQSIQIKKYSDALDRSKIYVDLDGIKKQVYKKIKDNFLRLQEYFKSYKHNPETFVLTPENGDENEMLKLKGNKYFDIYNDIVYEITDSFLNSGEYGLNVYLSVGIRHGTLLGQMRKVFEKDNFITLFDSNLKKYKSNIYWLEKMDIYDIEIKENIDAILNTFSEEIDKTLFDLKDSKIQVSTKYNDQIALFNYYIDSIRLFVLFYKHANEDNLTFESFIDDIFEFLWEKTENNLKNVRDYLNNDFKQILIKQIESMKQSLNGYKSSVNLDEFNQKVINLRTDLDYQIEKVSTWFTKENVIEIDNFTIELPVDIGLEYAKSINGYNKKCIVDRNIQLDLQINGKYLKWFVELFITIFDNVFKRSGMRGVQQIIINISEDENKVVRISCKNKLDLSKAEIVSRKKALHEKLKEINYILESEGTEILKRASQEGGSGLYKIVKIVKYDIKPANSKLDFGINDDTNEFYIDISMESGGILLANSNY
ncbi:hypothetical protein SAMN04487922_106130 [Bacillus toyonensis]|uniref:hypothetical protein n=1 Tax=Bacillus toyonensis TaxID=155322 RepID=UPI0008904B1C|nr:hypothetical protein [Bacillus toyonensis]SDK32142.1 hypothetical protein SAMN04487922_106130 [Bacillus toyonensis]